MKRLALISAAAALLLWAPPASSMNPYTPNAGISNTPHDFSQNYTVTTSLGVGLVGQCTMCHTPHKAQSSRYLWNHTYSGSTWTWSDVTQTAAGTLLTGFDKTWYGTSPKCLSCHDGTVAVGDVAWYDAKAQTITIDGTGAGVGLTGAGKIDPATDGAFIVTGSGLGGSDLKGNHPVAVPYPVGGAANTYRGITSGGSVVYTDFVTDPTGNKIVLYSDSGTDVKRVLASASGTANGIECSSCHDAHNKGGTDSDDYFLRGKLTGNTTSYICLKCHTK